MTPKVVRELERLRALATTRRAAASKATQRRLTLGKCISEQAEAATW